MSHSQVFFKKLLGEYAKLLKEAGMLEKKKEKVKKKVDEHRTFVTEEELPFIKKIQESIHQFIEQEERMARLFIENQKTKDKFYSFHKHIKKIHESELLKELEGILEQEKNIINKKTLGKILKEEKEIVKKINKEFLSSIDIKDILEEKEKKLITNYYRTKKRFRYSLKLIPAILLICISSQMISNYSTKGDEGYVPIITEEGITHFEESEAIKEIERKEVAIQHKLEEIQKTTRIGAATIYAQMFDKRTAYNGSTFHHDEMSCALPIGTPLVMNSRHKEDPVILKITNLENGKSLEVPVTDIGAFGYNETKNKNNKYKSMKIYKRTANGQIETTAKGNAVFEEVDRVVDISRAVAEQLGMITKEEAKTQKDNLRSAKVQVEIVYIPEWVKENIAI